MSLEYHTERTDDEIRIRLIGEMAYDELRSTAGEIRDAVEDHPKVIIVDLSKVTYLGEDGMALLLSLYRRAFDRGVPIYAEGAAGTVAARIHRSGFDRVLHSRQGSEH